MQSQKKRKLSGQHDFCRKNFPDKTRKMHQFSNSRQICVKSVFANFKHNHGPNMLHMVHLQGIQITQAHSQLIRTFFYIIRTFLGSSRNFPDYPDTFLDHPDSFQSIQIHFLEYPGTFYIIWKHYSSSLHFLDLPETFQFICTLCILSGYFVQYPDIFQNIRKFFSK